MVLTEIVSAVLSYSTRIGLVEDVVTMSLPYVDAKLAMSTPSTAVLPDALYVRKSIENDFLELLTLPDKDS